MATEKSGIFRRTGLGTECGHGQCTSLVHAKGLCQRHYAQQYRTGRIFDPNDAPACPMCLITFYRSDSREIYCSHQCKLLMGRLRRSHLTSEQFHQMYQHQDCRCAICLTFLTYEDVRLDHDHRCCATETSCGNCVRGLLCHLCNVGLGALGDTPQRVNAALAYTMGWMRSETRTIGLDAWNDHEVWSFTNRGWLSHG